jgi:hypothetical protein
MPLMVVVPVVEIIESDACPLALSCVSMKYFMLNLLESQLSLYFVTRASPSENSGCPQNDVLLSFVSAVARVCPRAMPDLIACGVPAMLADEERLIQWAF